MAFGFSNKILLISQSSVRTHLNHKLNYCSESSVGICFAVELLKKVDYDSISAKMQKVLLCLTFFFCFVCYDWFGALWIDRCFIFVIILIQFPHLCNFLPNCTLFFGCNRRVGKWLFFICLCLFYLYFLNFYFWSFLNWDRLLYNFLYNFFNNNFNYLFNNHFLRLILSLRL